MPVSKRNLNFVFALPAEAKPIIHYYELFPENSPSPYKFYRSESGAIWLVVSGVGAELAASATTFLVSKSRADEKTAWLNVGIGGQRDLPVGTPVMADKITMARSKQCWYPLFYFTQFCNTAPVQTVIQSYNNYPTNDVYEMEAAGFYKAASQIADPGMVHVLKVISDNHRSQIQHITGPRTKKLIEDCLDVIDQTVSALRAIPIAQNERKR